MDCKRAALLLEAYLDNELDRAEARELEQHVDGCAACRAALTRLGELRAALRDRSLRHAAPASLRERIDAAIHAETGRVAAASGATGRGRRANARLPAWSRLAAACVLAFAAGGASVYLWKPHGGATVAGESADVVHDLFAAHWRALAAASPVDVVSSDRHTVKPWFAGKVAQAPLVRDFAEQGFALAGGRIDYVGAQRVPVLVYRHGQHLIDVFVLPETVAAALPPSLAREGYGAVSLRLGGQPAVVVSDMDGHESAALARLLDAPQ